MPLHPAQFTELHPASFLPPFLCFPWTTADLAAAQWLCFHAILFSASLSPGYQTIWQEGGVPWFVYLFACTTGISGDANLSPLAEGSTSGISGFLCLLQGLSGMEWVGDLALSFKLILQQRFNMMHFLTSLSTFQSTCCLYTISFSYFGV